MTRHNGRPVSLDWDARHLTQFDLSGVLPPPSTKRRAFARRGLMATVLMEAAAKGRPIYYSRRKSHYAAVGRRYSNGLYTYCNVVGEIDLLAQEGLIDNRKALPGPDQGYRSEFEPKPELTRLLSEAAVDQDIRDLRLHEPIQRRELGLPVDYRDTKRSRTERGDIGALSEAFKAVDMQCLAFKQSRPAGDFRYGAVFREGDYCVNTAVLTARRIYNHPRQNLGGRIYGPWWQNTKKIHRETILIDGSPTVEPDYPCLHPSMLYALAGKPLDGDAYDTGKLPDGVTRKHVKAGLNILLNATSRKSALLALANVLACPSARKVATAIVEALEARHGAIAKHFGTGVGLRLQFIDSQMTMRLVSRLLDTGIVVLPIHDSYRCRVQDEGRVREEMDRSFAAEMGAILA